MPRPVLQFACALGLLALPACARERALPPLSQAERAALADTVREAVREYMRVSDSMPCERPDALLDRTVSFELGPYIYATDTILVSVTRDSALRIMRSQPCPSPVESARLVGAIEVQLLTRDHAVVGWGFEEDLREPDGTHQRVRGVVLESRARTPSGWLATSGMGSHVKVGVPRRLPE